MNITGLQYFYFQFVIYMFANNLKTTTDTIKNHQIVGEQYVKSKYKIWEKNAKNETNIKTLTNCIFTNKVFPGISQWKLFSYFEIST